jgi:hypothetical protein
LSLDAEEARAGGTAGIYDVLVSVVDAGIEEIVFEEVLDRVRFRRAGRQEEARDVVGQCQFMGEMPAGLIENDNGMGAFGDLGAELGEMHGHGIGVDLGQHQGRRYRGRRRPRDGRLCGAGPLVALVGCPICPLPDQLAFLADTGLIGKPAFYRAVSGSAAERVVDQVAEVPLDAAWLFGSLFGCCGRALIRRKPNLLISLDRPCS